jgi:transcriptional regulator with XRE-family HTH domain
VNFLMSDLLPKPRNRPSIRRARVLPLITQLRDARMRQGLTQEDLAHCIGAHASQISLWERGVKDPGLRNLTDWAQALGMEITVENSNG